MQRGNLSFSVKKAEESEKFILQTSVLCDKITVNLSFSDSSMFGDALGLLVFLKQNTRVRCQKNKTQMARLERNAKMASVRDAANYLVRLYYYGNRKCTSAAIQKLLIIAQMKYLREYNMPLFEEDLLVKPSCFSIKIISNTYPDIIFNEGTRISLLDVYENRERIEIPNIYSGTLPNLSSFYDMFSELNEQEIRIIDETYGAFGRFSGKCIGEFMQNLELHKRKRALNPPVNVTVEEIQEYLTRIAAEESTNVIAKFILRG